MGISKIKFVLLLFLPIFIFNISIKITGQEKKECYFSGKINNKPVKCLKCEVAEAGAMPYLLISIDRGGKYWMLDLGGIKKKEGKSNFSINAMEYVGKKMSGSYNAYESKEIKKLKKDSNFRYIDTSFIVKNRVGETAIIKGIFAWTIKSFPPDDIKGTLSFEFGNQNLKPAMTKISPWNQGFQITNLFIVKPGDTLNYTLELPSIKEGTYKKNVKLKLMHFFMNEKNIMKTNFINSENITVKITKKNNKIHLEFNGPVKEAGKVVNVKGSFTE